MVWDMAIVFGFPLLIVALAFGYAAYTRYLRHKERMAMIERGIAPSERFDDDEEPARTAREQWSPMTVTLVA